MLWAKNNKDKNLNNQNIIASGTIIEGRIYSPRSLQIEGSVTGEIISKRELIISKEGKVKANIKTKNTVVEGSFTGNIISLGDVRITPTGKLIGNIIHRDSSLITNDGGMLKGRNIIVDNRKIFKIRVNEKLSNIKIIPRKISEY
ncbi:MAG: polymer-forming cytoskeletal protein [Actinomycetota bacterium]